MNPEEICPNCNGKGYNTIFRGGGMFGDSFDGYVTIKPDIEKAPCKKCQMLKSFCDTQFCNLCNEEILSCKCSISPYLPTTTKVEQLEKVEEVGISKEEMLKQFDLRLIQEGAGMDMVAFWKELMHQQHKKSYEAGRRAGILASMEAIKANNWRHDELHQRGMEEAYKTLQQLIKQDGEIK